MQGIKLSSTAEEKAEFRMQTTDIMRVAARIETSTNWTPSDTQLEAGPKSEQIGQWAENVAVTRQSETAVEASTCQSNSSRNDISSLTASVENIRIRSGSPPTSPRTTVPKVEDVSESALPTSNDNSTVSLIDFSDDCQAFSFRDTTVTAGADTSILPSPASQTQQSPINIRPSSTSPSVASFSHIHRLVEPNSTRKRSKREDIILLKASLVNGFKCPPWDKLPSADEFLAREGTEPFT